VEEMDEMIVGVPKEVRGNEGRVALVPAGVEGLTRLGHTVLVQRGAGTASGFPDERFERAGALLLDDAREIWAGADMILKVKEPVSSEWPLVRPEQIIFTYFHFAASETLTRAMMGSGAVCIAYETVQLPSGELPLLTPMSEVAGRLAVLEGAKYLEGAYGGRGLLLGGVPGVLPARVVILGGGVVGANAARMAAGFGARVTVLDVSLPRLRYLADVMPANVELVHSNVHSVREQVERADVLIGGVLLAGRKSPMLVSREDVSGMLPGAVIVDVAVDQGGCVETTRPTTHDEPIYLVDEVVHYAVTNMPGAVPRTSTLALTNATFPFVVQLAAMGWREACRRDRSLRLGLNVAEGRVTHAGVAEALGIGETEVPFRLVGDEAE